MKHRSRGPSRRGRNAVPRDQAGNVLPFRGTGGVYLCGGLEIDIPGRELRAHGVAIRLGGRALDILGVLVRSAGTIVSKQELLARIRPGAPIDTVNVHVSAIRDALGPHRGLLRTVPRRGYCLLGTWTLRHRGAPHIPEPPRPAARFLTNIPVAATALVGRETAVAHLQDLLSAYRVVTVTGPGGIGKTVLAVEAARRLFPTIASDLLLVELAALANPDLVPSAVARGLGLHLPGEISAAAVAHAIGARKLLLLLDNCEHLIDAAAAIAETLLSRCPHATILATSREVLRIDGEFVYRVDPLDVPPLEAQSTDHHDAAELLDHSAVQLFIARTGSPPAEFPPDRENLAMIAAICRHLDGIPLALEFAAARAATLGIPQLAGRLHDRFAIPTIGRRTGHQTLHATLDWSYELLPEPERSLLRHLAIFPAGFTLEAAAAVTGDTALNIIDGIPNLLAKSLLAQDGATPAGRWRLLETTRDYALGKLADAGEIRPAARRHAAFFRDLVAPAWQQSQAAGADMARFAQDINHLRAALDWSFSPAGDPRLGIALAAAAAPVFLWMSLIAECHRWSERALQTLDDATRGGAEEMHLQASLGISFMHMHGETDIARVALDRALAIAEQRGDTQSEMGLLGMSHMFHLRGGDYRIALQYARKSAAVAARANDPAAIALAGSMLGKSLHLMGDLADARSHLEAALDHWSHTHATSDIYLAADHPFRTRIALARTLWLQGHPAQAIQRTHQAIAEAERMGQPVSLGIVLAWAASIFLWTGDLDRANAHIAWFIAYANEHALAPFVAAGHGFRAMLAIQSGDPAAGVAGLRRSLAEIHATRYELLTTEFNIALAQGLAALDRSSEAMALICETIALVETRGDITFLPELLRLKGDLAGSIELSRRLGTRAWELRAASDLAAL